PSPALSGYICIVATPTGRLIKIKRRSALAPPQQRAAVQAAAGFLKTHVASVEAVAIKLLSSEVVFALFEIEPNHRVGRAMPLRLIFVAEWRQHQRHGIAHKQRGGQGNCKAGGALTRQPSRSRMVWRLRQIAPPCG